MKALELTAWISVAIGVIFLLLAPISFILGSTVIGTHIINFFLAASSFFLLAIALVLFLQRAESKK